MRCNADPNQSKHSSARSEQANSLQEQQVDEAETLKQHARSTDPSYLGGQMNPKIGGHIP